MVAQALYLHAGGEEAQMKNISADSQIVRQLDFTWGFIECFKLVRRLLYLQVHYSYISVPCQFQLFIRIRFIGFHIQGIYLGILMHNNKYVK